MNNLLKLPSISEDDALVNLADWVELSAFFSEKKSASKEDLKLQLQRMPKEDDDRPMSRRLSDEASEIKANDVFSELKDRYSSCASSIANIPTYPFKLDEGQTLLSMSDPGADGVNLVYLFLLAVSVASMSSQARTLAALDPTKLFERLCADVLRSIWGGTSVHSDVMIFGTAKTLTPGSKKFRTNIETLCNSLGEGIGWKEGALAPGGGDGSLDLVAWRRFQDKRQGALVGFAQCKTGNNWSKHLTELAPKSFMREFMQRELLLEPIRLYMVPNRVPRHRWETSTTKGGLLIDRCRIVQYASNIQTEVLRDCQTWFNALSGLQADFMASVTS